MLTALSFALPLLRARRIPSLRRSSIVAFVDTSDQSNRLVLSGCLFPGRVLEVLEYSCAVL